MDRLQKEGRGYISGTGRHCSAENSESMADIRRKLAQLPRHERSRLEIEAENVIKRYSIETPMSNADLLRISRYISSNGYSPSDKAFLREIVADRFQQVLNTQSIH